MQQDICILAVAGKATCLADVCLQLLRQLLASRISPMTLSLTDVVSCYVM